MKKAVWISGLIFSAMLISQPALGDDNESEYGPWKKFNISLGGFIADNSPARNRPAGQFCLDDKTYTQGKSGSIIFDGGLISGKMFQIVKILVPTTGLLIHGCLTTVKTL